MKASFLSKLSLHDRSPNASCSNHSRPMGGEEDGRARPLSSRAKLLRSTAFGAAMLLLLRHFNPAPSTRSVPSLADSTTSSYTSLVAFPSPASHAPPPPPTPPPSIQLCVMMAKMHRVVPGSSWGSLTDPSERERWRALNCDGILEPSDLLGVQALPPGRKQHGLPSVGRGGVVPHLAGPPVVPVYTQGLAGYRVFRIPALVRAARSLLAFAEARPTVDDHGRIDLVMRRSTDGGRTWGPVGVVVSGGRSGQTIGNPVPIFLRKSQELMLIYCSNAAHLTEDAIREGKDGGTGGRRVWIIRSFDAGGNWTAPAEITPHVKRVGWTWYATGPGGAIVLRNGTLVVPATHAEGVAPVGGGSDFSHVLLSHDSGVTWQLGGSSLDGHTNECSVAELSDGRLLLNSRDLSVQRMRALQYSTDGGSSFGPPSRDAKLPESPPRGCHGSMASDGTKLFFASPSSPAARGALMLRRSDDGGLTWPRTLTLHAGPSAYSSMRLLPGGSHLGLLYERGESVLSFFAQRIVYSRVPLALLDEQQPQQPQQPAAGAAAAAASR